ncbi:hypothetical protein ACWFR1_11765 [Streptomyces sp. NPDC055103]
MAKAPKCCGRTMRADGRQFVCSKCKGWSDAGLALVVGLLAIPGVR